MNIFITGGAGFIGSNLVRYLIENSSDSILNYDKLTYAGNLESLQDIEQSDRYQFVQGDICHAEQLAKCFAAFQPNAVMHLAAESHVDRSIDGPGAFIQTNLVGTFQVLQAARQHYDVMSEAEKESFRFLHVSTDEVYGSLGIADEPFSETTPYDPHSPYSASKAGSDHLARAWQTTYGLPVLITNCSNNYGPYQFPEKLIPVVILKAIHGDPIPVYGSGENVRDWLYVEDHAAALRDVLTRGQPGETYNIGGNNELQNIQLVRMLCQILDDELPVASNSRLTENQRTTLASYGELIEFVTDRPGHDLRYAINPAKIRHEIGWQPAEESNTGLLKTVQWYLKNENWWSRILSGDYALERQGLSEP